MDVFGLNGSDGRNSGTTTAPLTGGNLCASSGEWRPKHVAQVMRPSAAAIAAALMGAVLAACGASGPSAASARRSSPDSVQGSSIAHGRDVRLVNLRLVVPPNWHLRRLQYRRCGRAGAGVLFGDLSTARLNRIQHDVKGMPFGSCTTAWRVASLPATYLLVDVTRLNAPYKLSPSRFPLQIADFPVASLSCGCSFRGGFVVTPRVDYDLRIWIGRRASNANRRLLREVIASIRPRNQ